MLSIYHQSLSIIIIRTIIINIVTLSHDIVESADGLMDCSSKESIVWESRRWRAEAVCALCEGLPAITLITYAWCSLDSPGKVNC